MDAYSRYCDLDQQIKEYASLQKRTQPLLLCVSKTFGVGAILELYWQGVKDFAENYLQEALAKQQELSTRNLGEDINWHFIGQVQSKKCRLIAQNFAYLHSLCSMKHASLLEQEVPAGKTLKVYIQINISEEANKAGVQPDFAAVRELASFVESCRRLKLLGLMAIPAPEDTTAFAAMQQLSQELQSHIREASGLSLGMSGDWRVALEHGSSCVRIGTAIFGQRAVKKTSQASLDA